MVQMIMALLLSLADASPQYSKPVNVLVPEWKLGFLNWAPNRIKLEAPQKVSATVSTLLTLRDTERGGKVEIYRHEGTPEAVASEIHLEMCGKVWDCRRLTSVKRSGRFEFTAMFGARSGHKGSEQFIEVAVHKHESVGRGSIVVIGTQPIPRNVSDEAALRTACLSNVTWVVDTLTFGEVVPSKFLGLATMLPDPSWDWLRATALNYVKDSDTGVKTAHALVFAKKKTQAQIHISVVQDAVNIEELFKKYRAAMKDLKPRSRLECRGTDCLDTLVANAEEETLVLTFRRVGPLSVMVVGLWHDNHHVESWLAFFSLVSQLGLTPAEVK